jgi:hypothetical protein
MDRSANWEKRSMNTKERWLAVAVMLAMLAIRGLWAADNSKTPTVKAIMTKAHKGGDSLLQTIGKGIKTMEPDWSALGVKTKELVALGKALGTNNPPRGERESWDKQVNRYLGNAEALNSAVKKMNRLAALAAHKRLTTSCASCHMDHKPS